MGIEPPDSVTHKIFQDFMRLLQEINYPYWAALITVNGIILGAYTFLLVIASITIGKIDLTLSFTLILGVVIIGYSIHQLILNFQSFRDIRVSVETIHSPEMLKESITLSNEERNAVNQREERAILALYVAIVLFILGLGYIAIVNKFFINN